MKYLLRYKLLQVGGWLSLLAPICILGYINREYYFRTTYDIVRVCVAFVIGSFVIILLILKKAHLGGEMIFIFIIGMLELLKSVLGDLQLIMIVLGCGYVLDKRIFMPLANYYKHLYGVYIDSKINATALKKVLPVSKPVNEARGRY